ncbi:hypothetical protein [Variovorax soli]|uniref:hypothetical protein n=2 Tax=Variovorax soli TaxID=376815 RepID=UPI0008397619|nr:hypothetical protein [Variovorax soli]
MTAGFQVFKPDGGTAFDSAMRVGRFLGVVQPPLGTSTYYDDRLADGGIPFAFAWPISNSYSLGDMPALSWPAITFSGNAMTVTRSNPRSNVAAAGFTVYFGVR